MADYSPDILYAYARLGLAAGASLAEIRQVLTNAEAYRFFTKARVKSVRHHVEFFLAREMLGGFDLSFAEIKKAYRQKAMASHPDRNAGDRKAEERLKELNAAYALIEETHQLAKDYYKEKDSIRLKGEQQAREATENERPDKAAEPAREKPKAEQADVQKPAAPKTARGKGDRVYMAAAVPRNVRTSRLGYLPLNTIIGSRTTIKANDLNQVFDIVMLPETQFLRAQSYLAVPSMAAADLQYGKFAPPYILRGIEKIIVPGDEAEPEAFAAAYFRQQFGLREK